jgi:serine/threonine-protein kinase
VPDETFAHVDRDIPAGTTVGEYTIESKLGEGGFGAVYRAVHPLIGKNAAVKVLSREFSANPQMVSRFIAEARAVNQIRHRNIIDIFSFGQLPDGRQYYIMELLEGMSFDALLKAKTRLELADALPIFRGIARALDAAHAKGILHRDLKPENVFLIRTDDGGFEPKLLDFGLVKLIDAAKAGGKDTPGGSHNTKTGTPMGTPYYMSPEQCRGLDVDARTDVYSFGAMAFEVLTGDVPYTGHSTVDILMQHMTAPVPSAHERCAAVPAALDGPLTQIMAKDPGARPAHVGEAVDLLAHASGIPMESQRRLQFDATMSDAERAVAPTVMLEPSTPPQNASSSPAQTFLGAETSIAPPKKSRAPILAGLVAALVGGAIVVGVAISHRTPARPIVQAAAGPSAGEIAHPRARMVELRIDGIPAETTVTADGEVLGNGGGPFHVKRGKLLHLELTAKGYKAKDLTVTPEESMLLSVELEPMPASSASAAPTPTPTHKHRPAPAASGKVHRELEEF